MPQLIGVVLAGGVGLRMGQPKATLRVRGVPLARRAATALWPLCSTVLVSVRPGESSPVPGIRAIEDAPPAGRGPLAGLTGAFAAARGADLLVLACDYPNVGPEFLRAIVSRAADVADLVMPVDAGGRDHPLVALWKRSAAEPVRQSLADGFYKVAGVLPALRVQRLEAAELGDLDPARALVNLNSPEDLSMLEPGGRPLMPRRAEPASDAARARSVRPRER